ncbi:hypothetical protein H4582DRAFT_1960135, partial [Lactarius indigo]
VLYAFSGTLTEGVALLFTPAKAVFTGVSVLLLVVQARRTPRSRFRRLRLHLYPDQHRCPLQEFHPPPHRHRHSAASTTQTVAVAASAVPPTMALGHKEPNSCPWPAIL